MRNTLFRHLATAVVGFTALTAHAQIVTPTVPYLPMPAPGAPNPYLQMLPSLPVLSLPTLPLPSLPTLPTLPGLPGLPDLGGLTNSLPLAGMPIPFVGNLQAAPTKPYTMRPGIPQQTKRQMMQMMMPILSNVMRMSMPDAMNWFTHKVKAKPGLSFDDVVESMMLRANKLNFKYVGNNLMYKDFRAVLGDMDAPRLEVDSFCDIAVGRDLLRISPEFLVFLPCRIGVMEDANKEIWVMMLDWNLDWVAGYEGQLGVTPELSKGAIEVRNKMEEIMMAGATGDL